WGTGLYRVDTADGSRTEIATLPGGVGGASHGLVAAADGNFYISVQGDGGDDRILKVSATGAISLHATLPAGCLQGLDRLPGGDLIATMRCTNALYRIAPDGTVHALRPGNGMATPQAMTFDLTGQLLVVNDESGRIVRVANGRGQFFAEVISYIPPMGFLAFEPAGNFYFSEAAPGFQPRLIRVSPQAHITEVSSALDWPSGLAFTPAGALYVSEYMSGEVSAVSPAGVLTTLARGLIRPQALAADREGNLYVAAYEGPSPSPDHPGTNRLWKIDPAGGRSLYATLPRSYLRDVAFSPTGELYVTGPASRQSGVARVAADGRITPFAVGFLDAVGLAFDLAGNLYVSDDEHNSITRITGFPRGAIAGRVTDAHTGQPIPAAHLSVVTGFPVVLGAQVSADDDGRYRLPVASRAYTVTATAPGYVSAAQSITVTASVTHTVDFSLSMLCIYLPLVLR
ncbi:MAG: carboxypeptidase regulatory-like domain-containing protein, partial [Anaerolineae bacterium]